MQNLIILFISFGSISLYANTVSDKRANLVYSGDRQFQGAKNLVSSLRNHVFWSETRDSIKWLILEVAQALSSQKLGKKYVKNLKYGWPKKLL